MDAQLKKALSGVAVFALIFGFTAGLFTTATAVHNEDHPLEATLDKNEFGATAEITVVNASASGKVRLLTPDDSLVQETTADPTGEAVFGDIELTKVGAWKVVDVKTGEEDTFDVIPQKLVIKLSLPKDTSTIGYARTGQPSRQTFSGQIVYKNDQTKIAKNASVVLEYPDGTAKWLNASTGKFTFSLENIGGNGAGKYNLTARVDSDYDALEEFLEGSADSPSHGYVETLVEASGWTVLTVTPGKPGAEFSAWDGTELKSLPKFGFADKNVAWINFTYPEDNKPVDLDCLKGDDSDCGLKLTLTAPTKKKWTYYNHWIDPKTLEEQNGVVAPDGFTGDLSFAIQGAAGTDELQNQIAITSADGWDVASYLKDGEYRLTLELDIVGATALRGSVAEYNNSASPFSFKIEKADVANFEVTLADKTVNPREDGLPASTKVTVKIFGQTQDEHPGGATSEGKALPRAWLNITGDILEPLTGCKLGDDGVEGCTAADDTDAEDGVYVFDVISIGSGGAGIKVDVAWRGKTYETTLPLSDESLWLEIAPAEVVIDTVSTVKATVKDSFGNPIPNADLTWFWFKAPEGIDAGTDINSTTGTGAANKGRNGEYLLQLPKENEATHGIGTVVVIAHDTPPGGDPAHRYAYAKFSITRAADLVTKINVTKVTQGVEFEFVTNVTRAGKTVKDLTSDSAETNGVFVMTKKGWENFTKDYKSNPNIDPTATDGSGDFKYIVEGVLEAADTVGEYTRTFENGLEAGTYYVFARNLTHDNLAAPSMFEVMEPMVTFEPASIPASFEPDRWVKIMVKDHDGNPLTGILRTSDDITPGDWAGDAGVWGSASKGLGNVTSTDNLTLHTTVTGEFTPGEIVIDVENGLAGAFFSGLEAGVINWTFQDSTSDTAFDVPHQLRVVGPQVSVDPSEVPFGLSASFLVTVKNLRGDPLKDIYVKIVGPGVINGNETQSKLTDAAGVASIGFIPLSSGEAEVWVGESKTDMKASGTEVRIYSGLNIAFGPSTPFEGDTVAITVTRIEPGSPQVPNANVVVKAADGKEVVNATTDITGTVRFSATAAGTYAVTAKYGAYSPSKRDITVQPKVVEPVKQAKFEISDLQVSPATVEIGNPVIVTVHVHNEGNAEGVATLKLKVNGATYDTKAVPLAAGETDTVAFQATPSQAQTYSVTVGIVGGKDLPAKSVTATKPTPPTPATPPPTTPPTPPPTTPPPTDPGAITPPTPETPGFEFVAALAALGAALIVLRRKK